MFVKIVIKGLDETKETECFQYEETDNSIIVKISTTYSYFLEDIEDSGMIPEIHVGEKLVKEYKRLPYKNSTFYDEDIGMDICLFPQAKYEFTFA